MATINIMGLILLCVGFAIILCVSLLGGEPLMVLLGMLGIVVGLVMALEESPTRIYEYPASEYTLDYRITIEGEQVDTTYVLTKIK